MLNDLLANLINLNYWFDSYPGPLVGIFLLTVWWLVVGLLIMSLVLWGYRRFIAKGNIKQQTVGRIFNFTLSMAILFGVSLFFSQTQTPVLGSRFWFLLWLVIGLYWLGRLLIYFFRTIPKQKRDQALRQAQSKYLP